MNRDKPNLQTCLIRNKHYSLSSSGGKSWYSITLGCEFWFWLPLDEVMQFARISDVNTIKSYNDRVNNMDTVRRIASKFTL